MNDFHFLSTTRYWNILQFWITSQVLWLSKDSHLFVVKGKIIFRVQCTTFFLLLQFFVVIKKTWFSFFCKLQHTDNCWTQSLDAERWFVSFFLSKLRFQSWWNNSFFMNYWFHKKDLLSGLFSFAQAHNGKFIFLRS